MQDIAINETVAPETFKCHECGETKPVLKEAVTGYGIDKDDNKVCYACCGKQDHEHMEKGLPICLYLSGDIRPGQEDRTVGQTQLWNPGMQRTEWVPKWILSNWPGSLEIPIYMVKVGRHNIARVRYDIWFRFAGHNWHGVMYGNDTQICHCKTIKEI
jgi:hypothetical protein